ncbi:MAG: hypothetical protein D6758_05295 [Gammaproteobacteria bacterium]|nr:MAG: hypothetical protein D6758_05295 [Gammaproteobacteria bacterium]
MRYGAVLPGNRGVLFANLGQYWPGREAGDSEKLAAFWEEAAQYSPKVYRNDLTRLAQRAREGEVVTAQLTQSDFFLPWEQRVLALSLALGRPREGFARICDMYVPVAGAGRALIWQMLGIYALFWLALMTVVSLMVEDWATRMGALGVIGAVAVLLLGPLGRGLIRRWIDPASGLWNRLQRFTLGRSVVVTRSLYQYLLNLGWCIQSGMDVRQSVSLAAETEPREDLRSRYQKIAADVKAGESLSRAFLKSGLLNEARLVAAPETRPDGKLWEPGVTDVVRQSWEEQLRWVATMLPVITGILAFTVLLAVALVGL